MERSFWIRVAERSIAAASEAMFPPNDLGAPDHRATAMVERTLQWMEELPSRERRLVLLLFVLVEVGAPFLGAGPGLFSKLPVARREEAIRRLRRAPFYPIRVVGESLKATLSMIYLSHPESLRYMGMFAVCAHPGDPFDVDVKPNALAEVDPSKPVTGAP
jgi:hypothetical protein